MNKQTIIKGLNLVAEGWFKAGSKAVSKAYGDDSTNKYPGLKRPELSQSTKDFNQRLKQKRAPKPVYKPKAKPKMDWKNMSRDEVEAYQKKHWN